MASSVIAAISYNKRSNVLRVIFLSGAVYEYKHVPEDVYLSMKAAESKGNFLNKQIKGNYAFSKVN
ncbi:MAG: KTSC domain-containing protein [Chitinophagaceae bacterium]